jgi:hypothetical protein
MLPAVGPGSSWARDSLHLLVRGVPCLSEYLVDESSRAPWKCDDETREMIQRLLEKRKQMAVESYINMANELGLSGVRGMLPLPAIEHH